jgi:hypothetical protein
LFLASAPLVVCLALWPQVDETTSFPKEFRRWAHVKSVLLAPQSVAYATEGGIHHIYANDKALEGYDSGKFPDGSVIVYDLLETKEVAGNTIEGPTRSHGRHGQAARTLRVNRRLGIHEFLWRLSNQWKTERRATNNLRRMPRPQERP